MTKAKTGKSLMTVVVCLLLIVSVLAPTASAASTPTAEGGIISPQFVRIFTLYNSLDISSSGLASCYPLL